MIFSYVISSLEVDVLRLAMMQRKLIREELYWSVHHELVKSWLVKTGSSWLGSKATVLPSYAYCYN